MLNIYPCEKEKPRLTELETVTESKDEIDLFEATPSIGTAKIGRRWSRRGGRGGTLCRSSSPSPIQTVKLKVYGIIYIYKKSPFPQRIFFFSDK